MSRSDNLRNGGGLESREDPSHRIGSSSSFSGKREALPNFSDSLLSIQGGNEKLPLLGAADVAFVPLWRLKLAVVHLGCSFSLLFTAYMVMQGLLTTIFSDVGFVSVSAVYLTYGLGSLVAPSVGELLGVRVGMVLAAAIYCGWQVQIYFQQRTVQIVASGFCGFAAALIWLCSSVWLTRVTERGGNAGMFTGIFFSLWSSSLLIGNSIALLLFRLGAPVKILSLTMAGVSAFAVVTFMFVKRMDPIKTGEKLTLPTRLARVAVVAVQRRTLLIIPFMIAQGIGQTFSYTLLPVLTSTDRIVVIETNLCYAVASLLTTFAAGYLYDRFGWASLLYPDLVCVLGMCTYCACVLHFNLSPYTMMGTAALCGISDNLTNTLLAATLTDCFAVDAAEGFAVFRAAVALTVAGMSIVALKLDYRIILIIYAALMIISVAGYSYFALRELPRLRGMSMKDVADVDTATAGQTDSSRR